MCPYSLQNSHPSCPAASLSSLRTPKMVTARLALRLLSASSAASLTAAALFPIDDNASTETLIAYGETLSYEKTYNGRKMYISPYGGFLTAADVDIGGYDASSFGGISEGANMFLGNLFADENGQFISFGVTKTPEYRFKVLKDIAQTMSEVRPTARLTKAYIYTFSSPQVTFQTMIAISKDTEVFFVSNVGDILDANVNLAFSGAMGWTDATARCRKSFAGNLDFYDLRLGAVCDQDTFTSPCGAIPGSLASEVGSQQIFRWRTSYDQNGNFGFDYFIERSCNTGYDFDNSGANNGTEEIRCQLDPDYYTFAWEASTSTCDSCLDGYSGWGCLQQEKWLKTELKLQEIADKQAAKEADDLARTEAIAAEKAAADAAKIEEMAAKAEAKLEARVRKFEAKRQAHDQAKQSKFQAKQQAKEAEDIQKTAERVEKMEQKAEIEREKAVAAATKEAAKQCIDLYHKPAYAQYRLNQRDIRMAQRINARVDLGKLAESERVVVPESMVEPLVEDFCSSV